MEPNTMLGIGFTLENDIPNVTGYKFKVETK